MYSKVRKDLLYGSQYYFLTLFIETTRLYFNFNDAPVVGFYPAGPVKQSGLVKNGAGDRIRTGNPLLGRQMP